MQPSASSSNMAVNYYICRHCCETHPEYVYVAYLDDDPAAEWKCYVCDTSLVKRITATVLTDVELLEEHGMDLNKTVEENLQDAYKKENHWMLNHKPIEPKPWKGPRQEVTQARRSTRHRNTVQRLTYNKK